MQAAIEVRAIGQRARSGNITLRDVSLVIGSGEMVAIIGGSGSGKSTLLDAMSGLRPPSSGTVLRAPRPAGGGRHIGYVPKGEAIHQVLPLGRALRYTAALRGLRVHDEMVGEALRVTALRGMAAVPVGKLNPGERKRAAVAAELLSAPALLFLEEPTGGLDPAQGAEVMRLLDRLRTAGTTVVLSTRNPLDAVRCDKVAVLAAGGHLAFFGTPAAAREYFAADSLDEIYERLAGLGDPAAAWARRFRQFSRTNAGSLPSRTEPLRPGQARLIADSAGPHSAGRPHTALLGGRATAAGPDLPGDPPPPGPKAGVPDPAGPGAMVRGAGTRPAPDTRTAPDTCRAAGLPSKACQLTVLAARNIDVLRRDRRALALLAGAPLAVVVTLLLLLLSGALGPEGATADAWAWTLLGGFTIGLAYGLPRIHREAGVLRADRFAGLNAAAYVLAKAVPLLPVLAAADAIALLVPEISGRMSEGYGPACCTLVLTSVIALVLALALSAAGLARPHALRVPAAPMIPVAPLAAASVTLSGHAIWADWMVLALIVMALMAVTTILVARAAPRGPGMSAHQQLSATSG